MNPNKPKIREGMKLMIKQRRNLMERYEPGMISQLISMVESGMNMANISRGLRIPAKVIKNYILKHGLELPKVMSKETDREDGISNSLWLAQWFADLQEKTNPDYVRPESLLGSLEEEFNEKCRYYAEKGLVPKFWKNPYNHGKFVLVFRPACQTEIYIGVGYAPLYTKEELAERGELCKFNFKEE